MTSFRNRLMGAIAGVALLYGASSYLFPTPKLPAGTTYEQALHSAHEITIQETWLQKGKHYAVFADDVPVGSVDGKNVVLFGDAFTLTTLDGKVLASEKENKRLVRMTRAADFYDGEGKHTGSLGEEVLDRWLSFSYVFHFYDGQGREIGESKKLGRSALNMHDLYNAAGNQEYAIDKRFTLRGLILPEHDRYDLYPKKQHASIPLEHAILLVCIEDVIGDSQKAKGK
ncbi:hypothetical protein HZB02_02065 [Candidatus Woesearchaeota archaeon]|nr:hypothetical protein [Candidatus Woesearchaeota archaeon]